MDISSRIEKLKKSKLLFDNRGQKTKVSLGIIEDLKKEYEVFEFNNGCFGYGGVFLEVLNHFDHLFLKIAKEFGAQEYCFPSLIPVSTMKKCKYFESFPHQIFLTMHLSPDEQKIKEFIKTNNNDKDEIINNPYYLDNSKLILNPAVCFHIYQLFENQYIQSNKPVVIVSKNKCFRRETKDYFEFERMLDFTMREIVFIGSEEYVKKKRMEVINLIIETVLSKYALNSWIELASDPFFVNNENDYSDKVFYQFISEAKYELKMLVPFLNTGIAVASFNVHGDFFAQSFKIKSTDNRPVWTGCCAFGLERWVYAFLTQYGLEKDKWPF